MGWKDYLTIDFLFVVLFGGITVFSLAVIFLGITGIVDFGTTPEAEAICCTCRKCIACVCPWCRC